MKANRENINPVSAARLKLIRSLQQKKIREKEQLYVVEGGKIVLEYVSGARDQHCTIQFICATKDWYEAHDTSLAGSGIPVFIADHNMIGKVSSLVSPQEVLAIVSMEEDRFDRSHLEAGLTVALESVRDPGNLGTIIRTADWFGIGSIICSKDSVDVYNPKVIQSAMGSTLRVKTFYFDLQELIHMADERNMPVYATALEGKSIYEEKFLEKMILLFGNESSGISDELMGMIERKITIPGFPEHIRSAESLNLATSVAIITSEIRRGLRLSGYSK